MKDETQMAILELLKEKRSILVTRNENQETIDEFFTDQVVLIDALLEIFDY